MEIGTIGAGDFAQAFAKRALKTGHKVKLSNNRGPESLREIVNQLGPGAMAVTKEEAAACEMVLLAVPWDNVPQTLASLPKWNNQILIDGTNPFHGKAGKFTPANVGNLSTSQLVAALAPGARVVKALNNMIVPNLEADPVLNGARRVAFISADVKFLCSEGTMQTSCLRLMGKKLLVALTMAGQFAGEGLQSLDEDDDMLSAMARELVERNGIGDCRRRLESPQYRTSKAVSG